MGSLHMPDSKTMRCANCGAELEYAPGTSHLVCPYCGDLDLIPATDGTVQELDYLTFLNKTAADGDLWDRVDHRCDACGAVVTIGTHVDNDRCPFCGSDIRRPEERRRVVRPRSLLPFHIPQTRALDLFRNWLRRRWFAPGDLKTLARTTRIEGVYMPYWTYDTAVGTHYTGRRGDHYYVTESYRDSKGRTQTRRKRKTRWRGASGTVNNAFDDILVMAGQSLPRSFMSKLEPWDLQNLVPFTEEYLAGFRVENYSVSLAQGFEAAQASVEPTIRQTVCRDIGGDVQHISTMQSRWHGISFKHLLLPVWISAYRYRDRPYRFVVNARTGEVIGERPWSWSKIALCALGLAALAAVVIIAMAAR